MSSGDAAVYQSIGNDLLHSFVAVTVETFLIGTSRKPHSVQLIDLEIYSGLLHLGPRDWPTAPVRRVATSYMACPDPLTPHHRRKTRTRVSVCTCFVVFLMFGLALALWMIDIHNVVTEIQITLLDTSTAPLSDVYFSAVQKILRLASVEDVVYSYLVSNPSPRSVACILTMS